MTSSDLPGHIETDKEGYMKDASQWDESIAAIIAEKEAIELSDDHWQVVRAHEGRGETFEGTGESISSYHFAPLEPRRTKSRPQSPIPKQGPNRRRQRCSSCFRIDAK